MNLTPTEVGAAMLVAGLIMFWLGGGPRAAKIRAILLLVGMIIVGALGHLGPLIATATTTLASWTSIFLVWLIGVPLLGAFAAVMAWIVIHDLLPKNSAKRRTSLAALALGAMIATGTTGIAALAGAQGAAQQGVTSVQTAVNGG